MRVLVWVFRALIFFTLFAFALNNQQLAIVHWFFGFEWQAPMVIVVLAVFAAGCALGVLAMVPGWWKHRSAARRTVSTSSAKPAPHLPTLPEASLSEFQGDSPPREAL